MLQRCGCGEEWRKSVGRKITNEAVLKMVEEKQEMVDLIIQRKDNWIGHVVRGDGLPMEVIEGKMDGKRARGRPRIGMLEELMKGSPNKKNPYQQMKRRAENRLEWRCFVHRTC